MKPKTRAKKDLVQGGKAAIKMQRVVGKALIAAGEELSDTTGTIATSAGKGAIQVQKVAGRTMMKTASGTGRVAGMTAHSIGKHSRAAARKVRRRMRA